MAAVQGGRSGVRAAWSDALARVDRAEPLLDPQPYEKRDGVAAGTWEGAPLDKLPPGCPVVPLGADGQTSYFVDTMGQLQAVGWKDWGHKALFGLFSRTPNYVTWAWPRVNKDGVINGIDSNNATACLMKAAAERGLFDPADRVRGRGAWTDKSGAIVWHSGDSIWRVDHRNNLERSPGGREIDGVFYPSRPAILEPWREPVTEAPGSTPAHEILKICQAFNFERPKLDPVLMLGWIGAALIGGALEWRPAVFATGDAATGKSTLQGMVKQILGDTLHNTADSTAAGIYQRVKQDSLPVAIDELEADADNRKTKAVINLARLASSGARMFRGGADHTGTEFQLVNAFFFSSINPPPLGPQDRSRLAMLNMRRLPRGAQMFPVPGAIDVFGRMLLRQLMQAWPRFKPLLEDYGKALRPYGFDSRAIAQYGTLLAIANLMLGDAALEAAGVPIGDLSAVGPMIAGATAEERGERAENWRRCFDHLLASTIDSWKSGEKPTVGSVLSELEADQWVDSDPATAYESHEQVARRKLAAAGLGFVRAPGPVVDGRATSRVLVAIPSSGPQLAKIFAGTIWSEGVWGSALRQAPPEVIPEKGKVVKIDRLSSRCLLVDLAAYDRAVTGGGQA